MMATSSEQMWLQRIADALTSRYGIEHREHQIQRLAFAVKRRMESRGISSYAQYWQLLSRDPAEWQRLVDLVTVTETWFYRHPAFYQELSRRLLPQLHTARPPDIPLRLWSTATATGEEAYTLAMAALESGVPSSRPVEVVGSDINREALTHAQRGIYDIRAARQLPARWKERYLIYRPDGKVEPTPAVRALVRFVPYNLVDLTRGVPPPLSPDVVMCTNVLMYFPEPLGKHILRVLHQTLPPDGVLYVDEVVGYMAREVFTPERVGTVIVYRPHPQPEHPRPTPSRPMVRPRSPCLAKPAPSTSPSPPPRAETLKALAAGRLDEAEALLSRWIRLYPLDFRAYFLRGRLHQLRQEWDQAREAYEQALYLRPTLTAAYLELGNIWRHLGNRSRARRMYQQALHYAPQDRDSAALGYPPNLIRQASERALQAMQNPSPS